MLIVLDESVAQSHLDPDTIAGIEAVLQSYRRGEHLVFAKKREVLEFVASHADFGRLTRATANNILGQYAQLGATMSAVRYRAIARVTDRNCHERDGTTFEISLRVIGQKGLGPSVLLVENIRDADLYARAAAHYSIHSGLKGLRTEIQRLHGGGGTISVVLAARLADGRDWVLCIADSDRLCPTSKISDSASNCDREASNLHSVADFKHTVCRELENLIPIEFIDAATRSQQGTVLANVESFLQNHGLQAYQHLDLKEGTTMEKHVFAFPLTSPVREYWFRVFDSEGKRTGVPYTCLEAAQCESPNACQCVVAEGFGNHLADKVDSYLAGRGDREALRQIMNSQFLTAWLDLGKHVFEWTCSHPPLRV